jgi:hypothetical protein
MEEAGEQMVGIILYCAILPDYKGISEKAPTFSEEKMSVAISMMLTLPDV